METNKKPFIKIEYVDGEVSTEVAGSLELMQQVVVSSFVSAIMKSHKKTLTALSPQELHSFVSEIRKDLIGTFDDVVFDFLSNNIVEVEEDV